MEDYGDVTYDVSYDEDGYCGVDSSNFDELFRPSDLGCSVATTRAESDELSSEPSVQVKGLMSVMHKLALNVESSNLGLVSMRRVIWGYFLGVYTASELDELVTVVVRNREHYRELAAKHCYDGLKKMQSLNPQLFHPLAPVERNPWELNQRLRDLLDEIWQDVERTYQERSLFKNDSVRKTLQNILYVWSREHDYISYKQGMNELLAVVYIVCYRDQVHVSDVVEGSAMKILFSGDFHDLEADAYALFDALLSLEAQLMFDNSAIKTPAIRSRHGDSGNLNHIASLPSRAKLESHNSFIARTKFIHSHILKSYDLPLYNHFQKIDLEPHIFLMRWIRLIFSREFNVNETLNLWDAVFADHFLTTVEHRVLENDINYCLQRLFKFPPTEDISHLISKAKKIRTQYCKRKLEGVAGSQGTSVSNPASTPVKTGHHEPTLFDASTMLTSPLCIKSTAAVTTNTPYMSADCSEAGLTSFTSPSDSSVSSLCISGTRDALEGVASRLYRLHEKAFVLGLRFGTTAYEPEYPLDASEIASGNSVRILKTGIAGSRTAAPGDRVTAIVRSFSPSVEQDISGLARQTFEAVADMLQSTCDEDSDGRQVKTWKVLIYDDEARALLSPMLKVGELRNLGVTLNMPITDRREALPGVDAVYLVGPTKANMEIILADAQRQMYKQVYVNFTTYSPDEYLGEFARKLVESNAHGSVAAITDRHVHFALVAMSSFSLNLPGCFSGLYGGGAGGDDDKLVDTLVDRLLSVLVTLGSLPVLVAPRVISPAAVVAEKLNRKLYEFVCARHQLGISLSSSFNRPMLLILDRTVDLAPMIQHSWNYQPLIHDIFGISFDKVVIETPGDKTKRVTHDLEFGDKLYQAIHRLPLSDVATHISTSLESYNAQVSNINREDGDAAGSLVTAMNAIPQLTEQKRLLDMHTNLATALVDAVKARDLDRFYEFEYDLDLLSEKNCFQQFEDLLANENSTAADLYRALLLIALARPGVSDAKLNELENRIRLRGEVKGESLKGLRNVMKMKAFSEGMLKQIQNAKTADMSTPQQINDHSSPSETPKRDFAQGHKKLAEYSSKIIDTGVNIFKGVRRMLPRKKQSCIVNIVDNFLSNTDVVSDEFAYYDPKTSESVIAPSVRRANSRRCVVFVVGGGSYNESVALQDYATRSKYSIVYGSTAFDRAEDFVEQLGRSTFSL
ncbi:Protein sly1 [Babesia sp. Xinjiang]|uniref:Protein sly1 n=1 Tax=Babesia sp. Xinjiang TaxID=462227 RepID=UPI000A253EB5|nr:Protein sly1 [Babesia sp. Xinjiang]ORM40708.1 Protein sly1 [Babesia sp. Xinjiang]